MVDGGVRENRKQIKMVSIFLSSGERNKYDEKKSSASSQQSAVSTESENDSMRIPAEIWTIFGVRTQTHQRICDKLIVASSEFLYVRITFDSFRFGHLICVYINLRKTYVQRTPSRRRSGIGGSGCHCVARMESGVMRRT